MGFLLGSKHGALIIKSSCDLSYIYILCGQITSFYCLFLMNGSALNLALKSLVRHDELRNIHHGVLRDALVEVSGTQILFI